MLENLLSFIVAFAATNIDDIFILALWYASRKRAHLEIVAGQFLGIFMLVGVSWAFSLIGTLIDARYVGLLGFFPIYESIRQAFNLFRNHSDGETEIRQRSNIGVISIAFVTIANGGDNIGVYVPLFSTFSGPEKIQLLMVFSVMTLLWCYLARYLSRHTLLKDSLEKYSHILVPLVLFLLGIFILAKSGALTLFLDVK